MLDASGNTTISGAATISGNAVVTGTLQANGVTGSVYPLVLGTAQASTSGTSIDFTGIPSWVRRVTVMLNGVSTNGTNLLLLQLGTSSGVVATGYTGAVSGLVTSSVSSVAWSTGAALTNNNTAAMVYIGAVTATLITGNTWIFNGTTSRTDVAFNSVISGQLALAGALDRVRITTVGGTDTFDAGSINLLWE